MDTPLLTTKLHIPPSRPDRVPRPRLIQRLQAGLGRKLTLVSAPAGFGKTTLLSEWAAGTGAGTGARRGAVTAPLPVSWLSLDAADNDPTRFWTYFVAALQTLPCLREAGVGQTAQAVLRSTRAPGATPPPIETLLGGLINEIEAVALPFVHVLDDFHTIVEPQIHEGLTFLLDHLPPAAVGMQAAAAGMHLILAGRADPPWPLARRRARGELAELRVQDLRFTPAESAAFLNDVMGLGLTAEEAAALETRTEGWISGLQMAALAMQGMDSVSARGDSARFIDAFRGSHRFVLDYLVEEVLDQQPPAIREFLLATSILERLTAPLCEAVCFGRAEVPGAFAETQALDILAYLEQANLFLLPLDHERRWYRYHSLFADLLRDRLQQAQPGRLPELHRRASEWYEGEGLIAEAVGHALAAGDIDRVERLVAGNALAMIYRGELRTLVGWLEGLPGEVVRVRPWLSVAHAWTLAYAGQCDAIEPLLQDADRALAGPDGDLPGRLAGQAEERRLRGHIAVLRAYVAALQGEMGRATELAREALQTLPSDDLMVRGYTTTLLSTVLRPSGDLVGATEACAEALSISRAAGDRQLVAIVLCDLAALHAVRGRLHRAAAACREAQQIARSYAGQSGQPLPVMGYACLRLSAVQREWNDISAATRNAEMGLDLCKLWGQADVLAYGYTEVAKVRQATGDREGAREAVDQGLRLARTVPPWPGVHLAAEAARLWLAQGNLAAAIRWVRESDLDAHDPVSFQHLFRYKVLARLLMAQGACEEAGALLARLLDVAEAAGAGGDVVEIAVLQALALRAQRRMDPALTALERALWLAEPQGYVRTFIEEGAPMGDLLQQATARGLQVRYVRQLLEALQGELERHAVPPSLIEPLTPRELEVLRLLATGLSNKDLAETLFIAPGTVKQHLKSIYGKLQAHNRTEAASRAAELGLL